jgi:2-oxoglutarate ferredoxin oxidoreductase subunit gamma
VRKEIVLAGSGGQGIQTLGRTLARALYNKGFLVSLKSSYGAEARGGASFSQVVIKKSAEDWPEVLTPDFLVAISQEGYNTWIFETSATSKVLFDADVVKIIPMAHVTQYPIPATRVANQLGGQIVANMVMLGAVAALTGLLSTENLFEALATKSKKSSDVNLKAVKEGYKLGSRFKN